MKKIFLFVFISLALSCNRNFDHSHVYRIIQEKFPDDYFILKTIEKAKQPEEITYKIPDIDFFRIEPDPLDFIIQESIKNLHYLFGPQQIEGCYEK